MSRLDGRSSNYPARMPSLYMINAHSRSRARSKPNSAELLEIAWQACRATLELRPAVVCGGAAVAPGVRQRCGARDGGDPVIAHGGAYKSAACAGRGQRYWSRCLALLATYTPSRDYPATTLACGMANCDCDDEHLGIMLNGRWTRMALTPPPDASVALSGNATAECARARVSCARSRGILAQFLNGTHTALAGLRATVPADKCAAATMVYAAPRKRASSGCRQASWVRPSRAPDNGAIPETADHFSFLAVGRDQQRVEGGILTVPPERKKNKLELLYMAGTEQGHVHVFLHQLSTSVLLLRTTVSQLQPSARR